MTFGRVREGRGRSPRATWGAEAWSPARPKRRGTRWGTSRLRPQLSPPRPNRSFIVLSGVSRRRRVAITRTASKYASRALRRYYNSRRVYAVTVSPPPRARISCLLERLGDRVRVGWRHGFRAPEGLADRGDHHGQRDACRGGKQRNWVSRQKHEHTTRSCRDGRAVRRGCAPRNLARATRSGENPRAD